MGERGNGEMGDEGSGKRPRGFGSRDLGCESERVRVGVSVPLARSSNLIWHTHLRLCVCGDSQTTSRGDCETSMVANDRTRADAPDS